LLGLINDETSISLEPGGQLELSIKPSIHISDIKEIYKKYYSMIITLLEKRNQTLITQGYLPASCVNEIPLLPKSRYSFMDNHFKNTGSSDLWE